MNFSNLCPGCMRELKNKNNSKCPHCGFDAAAYKQNTRCLPINTILAGKYLVGKVLGEGGFGITYIGFDLNMEVPVAIKEYFPVELVSRDTTTMHGDRVLSMSGEKSVTYKAGLKKYVAEAQNVSKFSDMPGVVSVKDFFYENDTAYIVMEYIDGISLKEYLKQKNGKLTESETLQLIRPVLEALQSIHASGIVHRDISPDNIMLTFKADNTVDSVKLIDFGAARMTEKNDQHSLTIILKHGYAPEEQYRTHGEQGPWTDVYAICATMYRMLTGVTPEPAMDRIFQDKLKRPSELGVGVSKAVEEALMEGLAVKKEDRIAGIAELREALGGTGKRRKNAVRTRRTGILVGIGAVFFIGMVGIGGLAGIRGKSELVLEQNLETIVMPKEGQSAVLTDAESDSAVLETVIFEEEKIGEQIVFYKPQHAISGVKEAHTLMCMPDGTVSALGNNRYGQCMVQDWDHIAAVAASNNHSLGLREDGKVYAVGLNTKGECETENWSNIVEVAAASGVSFGLREDGKIEVCGDAERYVEEIADWNNIKSITVSEDDQGLIALDEDGRIHYAGFSKETPEIIDWQDVSSLCCGSLAGNNLIGIRDDGSIVRQELEENLMTEGPQLYAGIENWTGIQQICANTPVMGVKLDGTAICLDSEDPELIEELHRWENLEAISSAYIWDRILIIGLQKDGTILQYRKNEGNAELEEMKDLAWAQITNGNFFEDGIVAGTSDGRLMAYGIEEGLGLLENEIQNQLGINAGNIKALIGRSGIIGEDGIFYGKRDIGSNARFGSFQEENVAQAVELWDAFFSGHSETAYAFLKKDGHVKIVSFGDPLEGSGIRPEEYLTQVKSAEQWENVIQISGINGDLYGLHADGTISTTVEEQKEQLLGISGIIKMAERNKELLGLQADGSVVPILTNEYGVAFGRTQVSGWKQIVDIAMGESHVAGLREDGTVIAAGSNHAGQCDVDDWTDIVSLAVGKNCTLGITSDGRLMMAGSLY